MKRRWARRCRKRSRRETLQREDLFVTTKLWNTNHRPERVKPAFDASRRRLQLDYIDCYIIHTPFAFQPGDEQDPRDEQGRVIYDSGVTLVETWRAMERLVDDGHCRSIGLSDITLEKLREIVAAARIKPAVVQVESHPYLPEWELLDFCREHGIVMQAFAALGHAMEPNVLDDPVITAIAQRVHKTPAQVALAWAVQRGTAFLTTSTKPQRIQESFDISTLPEDAMREIRDRITTNVRFNSVVRPACPDLFPGPVERQAERLQPRASQIDYDVALGPRATDQQIALRRRIDRVRPVADLPRNKPGFAGMADPGSTRPPHRHVACLGQLEQALERRSPPHIEPAAGKRHHRSLRREPPPADAAADAALQQCLAWWTDRRRTSRCGCGLGATPNVARPAVRSLMKVDGPQI